MKQFVGPLALGVMCIGMAPTTDGCGLVEMPFYDAARDPESPGNGSSSGNPGPGPGGGVSPPQLANGTPCINAEQCQSGYCNEKANVCCNSECKGACEACNLSGKEGTCSFLPQGWTSPDCNDAKACNGKGTCALTAGGSCSKETQCVSGSCIGSYCRSELGKFCTDDVECASNRCVEKKCVRCTGFGCSGSTSCDTATGACKALPGQPCGSTLECEWSACQDNHLCARDDGQSCFDASDCTSWSCFGGACTPCGIGPCLLPVGAYCTDDPQCEMDGKCTGFPRRCARPSPSSQSSSTSSQHSRR
jgi:hypothetical protein